MDEANRSSGKIRFGVAAILCVCILLGGIFYLTSCADERVEAPSELFVDLYDDFFEAPSEYVVENINGDDVTETFYSKCKIYHFFGNYRKLHEYLAIECGGATIQKK